MKHHLATEIPHRPLRRQSGNGNPTMREGTLKSGDIIGIVGKQQADIGGRQARIGSEQRLYHADCHFRLLEIIPYTEPLNRIIGIRGRCISAIEIRLQPGEPRARNSAEFSGAHLLETRGQRRVSRIASIAVELVNKSRLPSIQTRQLGLPVHPQPTDGIGCGGGEQIPNRRELTRQRADERGMQPAEVCQMLASTSRQARRPRRIQGRARLHRAQQVNVGASNRRYRLAPRHLEAARPERVGDTRHRGLEA